ncbi:MAG TPA: PglZ domain-containing protein [Saprospiraceae bacterium]|jgi:CheY-like chemotaxis protein|nr:PglZ domain-containing protein [Saprospiraceae bacterium]HRO08362.1 PglZ domain-containing protein [Saprospiraceae bacterium]HRO73265.1 PglZ domain-containing protein [Saprospiraceae bacterium]HRP41689.1 PglZ domain-containing protein [Saprospiraceae bacterium]
MSNKIRILWADDEIDLLKPQLFFLEKKDYEVITVTNGHDALDKLQEDNDIDVVFLDESMPGLTGLETLSRIKSTLPGIPVVMITKNETENIMEEAIGSQIDDYLIKPVNPNQILLSLKKIVDNKKLVKEQTAKEYMKEIRNIFMDINDNPDYIKWAEIYKKIISWELRLDESENSEIKESLDTQKEDANREFFKYISSNYLEWIQHNNGPVFSHTLMREKVLPLLSAGKPVIMILMDNLRYDQWKIMEPEISELFKITEEDNFYAILPTATQYSRNAIFAGMLPGDIQKKFPDLWLNDNDEGGKNMHEQAFLENQVSRLVKRDIKLDYTKVTNVVNAKRVADNALNYTNNDLTVIVYNFLDMVSHSRTEMEVLKELAGDEKAYRSLTKSWFENSPLYEVFKKLADRDVQIVVTTDHGTIRVRKPSKVVGDRETTTNLRYKAGRNLQYDKKDVFEVKNPADAGLPSPNVSTSFIFAKENLFFLYPNNYNQFLNHYTDSYQHGGVSMEEMICPVIRLVPKKFS